VNLCEEEDRWREGISSVIRDCYASVFSEDECHVGVIVLLSNEDVTVEREEYDPERTFSRVSTDDTERTEERLPAAVEGGLGGFDPSRSALRTTVRSKTEEVSFASKAKTLSSMPRGSVKALGVNVLLDLVAVEKVLAHDLGVAPEEYRRLPAAERESLVAEYKKVEEASLVSLLPFEDAKVRVKVQPFSRAEGGPASVAASVLAGRLPPGTSSAGMSSGSLAWIGGGALMVLVIFLVLRRVLPRAPASRSRSSVVQGPTLSTRGAVPWRRSPELPGSWARAAGTPPAAEGPHEPVLGAVGDTARFVRGRPEAAASVLRFWLSQDGEAAEGAARS
jgi:hypothetical protein